MRKVLVLPVLLLLGSAQLIASDRLPGDLKLLEGYHAKHEWGVDALIFDIKKSGGPTVHFEAGPSEGSWADPEDRSKYAWYREQVVNGHKVRVALIRPGLKTAWEPEDARGLEPGSILLVTFLLGGEKSAFTANFAAKVASQEEMADVLLMALTFNPDKLFSDKKNQ